MNDNQQMRDEWAPDRLWLQRGFADDGGHTWCSDSQPEQEQAEYVRVAAPAQSEAKAVDDSIIAGALFDFLGFLTTRDDAVTFSASHDAKVAVEILRTWANKRNLDLEEARVDDWPATLSPITDAPAVASGDASVDQCIDLAVALEQQRALAIVKAVRDQGFAKSDTLIPTQAESVYDLACEEIEMRLRTEQWTLGDYEMPLPAHDGAMGATFQARVQPWMLECFGPEIAANKIERNHRFFEEATEAVQANGMTRSEAHQLVDYTFDRPIGDLPQEIGGVMVTLAALCLASGQDMHGCGETELARVWTKVEQIRAKQAAKPKHSPLPAHVATPPTPAAGETGDAEIVALRRSRDAVLDAWDHYEKIGEICPFEGHPMIYASTLEELAEVARSAKP